MKKNIIVLVFSLVLTSCASISEKIPKMERKSCDGSNKTIADILCKKS